MELMETIELKKFLKDVGNSVHSMNTIAVALSLLPDNDIVIPKGLEISWKPKNIEHSILMSRNFAERSAYVYASESLFEYLENISTHSFWSYPELNFKGDEKKAIKVYNFLINIPGITKSMAIMGELLCHWRNRIVHLNISNANISSNKKDFLLDCKTNIYNDFHHFDVSEALNNFNTKKITLKDVSTLITIMIQNVRLIDKHFFNGIANNDLNELIKRFKKKDDFSLIFKQSASEKRERKIKRWIEVNYPYLSKKMKLDLEKEIIKQAHNNVYKK